MHCLWECNKIQLYQRAVCANISTAISQRVSENPLYVCLGESLTLLHITRKWFSLVLVLASYHGEVMTLLLLPRGNL